jgi:glycosyltransferase involved in cell wall biosynthesis
LEPFLSIVIPTYHRAALLKRCLESVLACSAPDIEVLVSDNASPDDTPQVLASFSDARLRYWRNPQNVGAEPNILGLWRGARGKWIFCLTDDDYLLAGALDKVLAILKQNPDVGVFMSDLQIVNEAGEPQWVYEFCKNEQGHFEAGFESMSRLVWAAHVFSRITFQRAWADIEGSERHLASMYPQMYVVLSVLRDHPALYSKELFVAHTEGNRVFWRYTPDKMVCGKIALIKDGLSEPRWKKERKFLIQQIVRYVGSAEEHSRTWKEGTWKQQQKDLLSVPEVRYSFRYWRRLMKFLLVGRRPH